MTMPLNFFLVHDGTLYQTVEVFEQFDDAVAHADEMASYEGAPWYVAGCLMPNAVAYTAGTPKKVKKKSPPKRSKE